MDNGHNKSISSAEIRTRLDSAKGKEFWRSIEELAETEQFQQFLEDEFPQQSRPLRQEVDRRQFLTLMGASLALAGLSGCRFFPKDKIIPYVNMPEHLVPGIALTYATAFTLGGYAMGLLAESHEGRPTKLEGNPKHPASLGATSAMAQAALLDLYDPDRSTNVTHLGDPSSWDGADSFLVSFQDVLTKQKSRGGAGLRILTETVTSPTLAKQITQLLKLYPSAKWVQYEPVNRDNAIAGSKMAFGEVVNAIHHFDKADVILSLDSDFLMNLPASVRYARDFADRRRVRKDAASMNRLYSVESTPTITSVTADHHLPVKAAEVELFARALAAELGLNAGPAALTTAVPDKWVKAIAKDLKSASGRSVVIAGDHLPASVHALTHSINASLGAVGQTLDYTAPVEADPSEQTTALKGLIDEMKAGQVEALVILGGNPVYYSLADLPFAEALKKVPYSVHLSLYQDETSALTTWHVPGTHFLETWSDARAYDGTVSIVQPLIQPLYEGKSLHDIMAFMISQPGSDFDRIHDSWKADRPGPDFEKFWEKTLNEGVMSGTALPVKQVTARPDLLPSLAAVPITVQAQSVEINFRPDVTIHDGRNSNNGWMMELPKPITRLSWDNAIYISPKTAVDLGICKATDISKPDGGLSLAQNDSHFDEHDYNTANERVVQLKLKGRTIEGPIWIVPDHADNALTVHLGFGRTKAGKVGTDVGFNVNTLRTSDAPWSASGLEVAVTGKTSVLSTTQYHHTMEGRDIIRMRDISEFQKSPEFPKEEEDVAGSTTDPTQTAGHGDPGDFGAGGKLGHEAPISLYDGKEFKYDGYAWGMSIDLTTCIGCNACVQACQAENNIPVVGKDQVKRGRDMHWLRIDSYYKGPNVNRPEGTFFQAVMCMHCEQAPCEPVCPVAATVHSHEGLNQMIYNRCVGTKYCSNNCPYKVRRFNFYKYTAGQPDNAPGNYDHPQLKLMANPNVTVRGRGVMEKCSFCVQRINAARITSKKENRQIQDGEIVTACQQACPTQTIVFGNIADPNAKVTKLKGEPHDYSLLGDLGTRPRLTYLAKMRNLNPELV